MANDVELLDLVPVRHRPTGEPRTSISLTMSERDRLKELADSLDVSLRDCITTMLNYFDEVPDAKPRN